MKSRRVHASAYLLLLVLWAKLVLGAQQLSLSMDEPLHIAAGYTYLARGQASFWLFPLNLPPPLLNSGNGVLLLLSQPNIPLETLDGWGKDFIAYTNAFLPYLKPMERTEVLARTPMMLLVMLLAALVFRWAKEIGNAQVGLLALFLLVFDPTLVAHGRLAHTDTGTTAVGMAALYAVWRWMDRPTWKWALVTGVLLGLTLLAKFSGILWIAAFGLLALWKIVRRRRSEGALRALQAVVVSAIAFGIVWAAFGFSVGRTPLAPVPLPAPTYWTAFYNQQGTASQRIFIAFEKIWLGTQWWYFPLNFFIKNPLPLLIAFLVGGWMFIRRNWRSPRLMALIVFPLIYAASSITAGMNVSYRHLYPVHPFLYLMAAKGLSDWVSGLRRPVGRSSFWGQLSLHAVSFRQGARNAGANFAPNVKRARPLWLLLFGVLGAWYVLGTLLVFPDELSYFNELVGGPNGGYHYLVDFTRDWGQAFKQLRTWLGTHPGPEPQVVYFTAVHPGFYGIAFHPIQPTGGAQDGPAPFHPQPGRYVMGDAPLYGLVGPDPQQLDWFRRARPTATVGHSLFVYDVTTTPTWVSQCVTPSAPLDNAAIATGFGRADLRRADFDCTTAWLYPGGGNPFGVYALHHDLLVESRCFSLLRCDPIPADPFIARHLSGARLAYEQRYSSLLPAFVLYEREEGPRPLLLHGQAAPAGAAPASLANVQPLTTPVSLDGPFAFLGVAVYPGKDELELETWWQVTQTPITRPLSIMAHLLTEQGQSLGVADGLGISPLTLATGDIVVQRHRFAKPPEGNLWLRTGAYWLDTTARWAVTESPGSDALFVPLKSGH